MNDEKKWYIIALSLLGFISVFLLYFNPIYSLILIISVFVTLFSLLSTIPTVYKIIYILLIIMALFQTTIISYFIMIFIILIYYLRVSSMNQGLLKVNYSRWIYFFLVWIFYGIGQIIFLEVTDSTIRHFNALLLGFLIIWLMTRTITSFSRLEVFYNLWGYCLLVVIILGWYEILTGNNLKEIVAYPDHFAATVGFYNKNDYSFMIGMSFPIVLYWFEGKITNKIIALFMTISALHHVFINGTRSVLLLIILILLLYVLVLLYRKKYKTVFWLGMIILTLCLVFNRFVINILNKIFTLKNDDSSINIRNRLNDSGIEIFKEYWSTGVGPGNVNYYMPNIGDSVHHFWIELMANFGIFIIVGFISFYIYNLCYLLKNLNLNSKMISPVLLMMCIFIPISTTPSSVFQFKVLWVFIGLIITVNTLISRELKHENYRNII